ncbi:hypothetical protein BJY52DRAFT_1223910 [Lactarius psammicola]|nr:hypothetical protein BJY52DRAFT_1223910 [Lactarius psammicola]
MSATFVHHVKCAISASYYPIRDRTGAWALAAARLKTEWALGLRGNVTLHMFIKVIASFHSPRGETVSTLVERKAKGGAHDAKIKGKYSTTPAAIWRNQTKSTTYNAQQRHPRRKCFQCLVLRYRKSYIISSSSSPMGGVAIRCAMQVELLQVCARDPLRVNNKDDLVEIHWEQDVEEEGPRYSVGKNSGIGRQGGYKFVADLEREIQSQCKQDLCKDSDVLPGQLILLKAGIDPSSHEGATSDLRALDDAENLCPVKQIYEICDRPAQGCKDVEFTREGFEDVKGGNLGATLALFIQHEMSPFEYKGLYLNEPLGERDEIQKIPVPEVIEGVRRLDSFRGWRSGCRVLLDKGTRMHESTLLYLSHWSWGHRQVGNLALCYFLLRRPSDKKPTTFQVSNHFVLFRDNVRIYSGKDYEEASIPEGTLVLTGANKKSRTARNAFLVAEQDGIARIIQTTSLSLDCWKDWHENHRVNIYLVSMSANSSAFYNMWGPSAHNCVRFSQRHSLEGIHRSHVNAAAREFVRGFRATQRELDGLKFSDPLFFFFPFDPRTTVSQVVRIIHGLHTEEFYSSVVVRSSTLDAHYRLGLNTAHEHTAAHPILFTSESQTRGVVDAIVCSDKVIITVKVTVSRKHGATPSSFEQIRAQLPVLFGEARRWCYVFVTSDGGDTEALRYDPTLREDLPAGLDVTIYTAAFRPSLVGPNSRALV